MYYGWLVLAGIGTIIFFALLVIPWNKIKEKKEDNSKQKIIQDLIARKIIDYEWEYDYYNNIYVKYETQNFATLEDYIIAIKEAHRAVARQQEAQLNHHKEMTVEDFFKLRKKNLSKNFAGVYILHNKSKDKYYVGQAQQILNRVNNHFTGKGNGDVYADYKYGNRFSIKLLPLKGSGYSSLNKFEKSMITKFRANKTGYNKTAGNN